MRRHIRASVRSRRSWIWQRSVSQICRTDQSAHVVNFTDIQLYIYDKCPHDELTIIMRRYMMRIAEHFRKRDEMPLALITGESIGQVASQTMQSLAATNEVCYDAGITVR